MCLAWQLARELTGRVYGLTRKPGFAKDFGLKKQVQDAAGSSMHNIAEGFDSETNSEFVRFLRYAKRSCSEVQSELYVALDQQYITKAGFRMCMIMPDVPAPPFVVSSSTCWLMSRAGEIKATLNL